MTAFLLAQWPKLAAVGAALALCAVILVQRAELAGARGDRDVARANLVMVTSALDAEKLSTSTAVGAAGACAVDSRAADARCTGALAGLGADLARARGQLRGCTSPAVLTDRMRALFPAPAVK